MMGLKKNTDNNLTITIKAVILEQTTSGHLITITKGQY
jgi:hypothetical protein